MVRRALEPSGERNGSLPRSSISCLSEAKLRFWLSSFGALLCRVDFDTAVSSGKRIGVPVQGEYIWAARNAQTVSPRTHGEADRFPPTPDLNLFVKEGGSGLRNLPLRYPLPRVVVNFGLHILMPTARGGVHYSLTKSRCLGESHPTDHFRTSGGLRTST